MDNASVTFALVAVVSTCVGGLLWLIKYLIVQMRKSQDSHTAALLEVAQSQIKVAESQEKVAKASDSNTQVSKQILTFLTRLNGHLPKATQKAIKENKK